MPFIEVTKDKFFSLIGPRDIVSSAEGRSSDPVMGLWSKFETRNRVEVGRIVHKKYFLREEFIAKAN